MESKVEAVLAGKKSTFPADEDAVAMASSSSASPAAIFALFAPPLPLLRHVASLCTGYLGLDGGGLKPSVPAPASSSSSAAAARLPLVSDTRSRLLHPKIARRWCLRCGHEGSRLHRIVALPGNPE